MPNSVLIYASVAEVSCRLRVMLSVAQRLCCWRSYYHCSPRVAHHDRLISDFPWFMYIPNFNMWFCGWRLFYCQLLSRQPHTVNSSDDNTGVIMYCLAVKWPFFSRLDYFLRPFDICSHSVCAVFPLGCHCRLLSGFPHNRTLLFFPPTH